MSRGEGMKLALVVIALAACQARSAEPTGAGSGSISGSATPQAAPALRLTACAVADPRPSHMRSGFPSVQGIGIRGPDVGEVGSKGGGTGLGRVATRPRVTLGPIEVTGALDRLTVRRLVRRRFSLIEGCDATARAKTPQLEGTLSVAFDLETTGMVKNVRATGMTGSLPACVAKVVEDTKFPAGEGGTNRIKLALTFLPPSAAPQARPPTAWSPYAMVLGQAPADPSAVEAIQVAIRAQLAELDACFGTANGSLRAMISVTADGHVQRARVGGLGVHAPEVCISRALQKLAVAAPAAPVELACDLVRAAPQPWRVTREAYAVVEVDATRILSPDGSSHGSTEDLSWNAGADGAYLVLATPDATGSAIERAMVAASGGSLTIVAVTATGGPPVFVGVGPDLETSIDGAGNLGIAVTRGIARVCTDGADVTQAAPVIDPSALDRLIAAGLAACKTPCTTASVSVVGDYVGKDLVAVTAAARRAKLATIVAGQDCLP